MPTEPANSAPTKIRFAAIALLLVNILATVALLTKTPGAAADHSRNWLGPTGDWLALAMRDGLGHAAYLLLACWLYVVVLMLRHASRFRLVKKSLGCTLLLLGVTVFLAWLGRPFVGGPPTGPGGTLGDWLQLWLAARLPAAGQYAAVALALLTGVALVVDRSVVGRLGRLFVYPLRRLRAVFRRRPARSKQDTGVFAPPFRQPRDEMAGIARMKKPAAPPPEDSGEQRSMELPPVALLADGEPFPYTSADPKLREIAQLLEKTFADFGLTVKVVGIHTGPVITQFEIALETGLRVNKVTNLADDLALNLRVSSVRVVAPIPGKNTVGIEVPNERRAVVRLKELITSPTAKTAKAKLPLFLGKDTEGLPLIYDLAEMPHLLIAGRTGTGKSVCMNAVILSLLMTRTPDEVRMIMIDPKMLELSEYGKIPHLMHPVVKDMKKAEAILAWAVDKMEERYDILARARVRSIAGYNELSPSEIFRRVNPLDEEERQRLVHPMPYIVIFIDEMNDLMMTMKKEVESHIIRLAQKSRAAGIHLIVATQKPTVDVITGLIKSNLPARICFQVSSRTDSRVVLDEMGADKLLGKGDLLFLQPGTSTIIRAQGTYASDSEIQNVVNCLECEPEFAAELVQLKSSDAPTGAASDGSLRDQLRARDEVYEDAIDVVVREGRGSVSLLQRALGIGYGRAARLIDYMAEDGIVGNYNGSQAREVLYSQEEWEAMKENNSLRPEANTIHTG